MDDDEAERCIAALRRAERAGCVCAAAVVILPEPDPRAGEVEVLHDCWCPFLRAFEGPVGETIRL